VTATPPVPGRRPEDVPAPEGRGDAPGRSRAVRAVRAEVRKLATLRSTLGFAGLAAAYVLLNTVAVLALQGVEEPPVDLATRDGVRTLLATGAAAYLFATVVGIMSATAEYRHGTITPSLLAQPSRPLLLAAKGVAAALAGVLQGVVGAVVCLGVALPWLALVDHAAVGAGDVARAALGTVAGVALFGVLGAALGALVRSQVVALVAGLVWLVLGEGLLLALVPEVGRWPPSGALAALTGSSPDVLPAWAGALLLAGYALVLRAAAIAVERRRDGT
jgi:ABC-2 type transport system permease protein